MNLLPYSYKQRNSWTCGPAVTRIICDYYGIEKKISQLTRELKTTRSGTANADVYRVLRKHRIPFRVKKQSSVQELRRRIKNSILLVAYWIPRHREAHYSIIKKIAGGRIYFHDTWYGSSHSYSLPYFERNWWDPEATRWFLAIPR